MLKFLGAVLACASLACAQSITVTASRSASVQADELILTASTTGRSFEAIVARLKPLGVTTANFSGLRAGSSHGIATQLIWTFTLTVPLAQFQSTINALQHDRRVVNFSIEYTDVSTAAMQAQSCSWTDLVNDARTQAQKLAAAANMKLGPIVGLSDEASTGAFTFVAAGRFVPARLIDLNPPCSLTVQFTLN